MTVGNGLFSATAFLFFMRGLGEEKREHFNLVTRIKKEFFRKLLKVSQNLAKAADCSTRLVS